MSDKGSTTDSPVRRLIGAGLLALGILWMGLSGLCSAVFAVMLFTENHSDISEALSVIPMIVIVGGFSIGIGFVLNVVGRALRPK